MCPLRELNLKYQYRPNEDNLVDDFYTPCLSNSKLYRRAVGYFTSGSLALASRGLVSFINRSDGQMLLIASPALTPQDKEAIEYGYEAREDVISKALIREIQYPVSDLVAWRLGCLSWMIAHERLDIKIALVSDLARSGIYHEKIGLFTDELGNTVAFSGSSNETEGGLYSNFEAIEVYCSWRNGDDVRVRNKIKDFDNLWNDSTLGLDIIPFPEAVKEGLIRYQKHYRPGIVDAESSAHSTVIVPDWLNNNPRIPPALELRDYQKDAIRKWFSYEGSGLLEMATGTGKTITALAAATKLYETRQRLGVIILAPYKHLVDQWEQEASKFGYNTVKAYESSHEWTPEVVRLLSAYQAKAIDCFCIITTTATFIGDPFQNILKMISGPTLIIADEAHHLGASHIQAKLPKQIKYRLGLSATPNRWYDEDGSTILQKYFEPGVIFTFGLKEAIDQGFLTRYFYYPHIVELTDEENQEYYTISRKIVRIVASRGKFDMDEPGLQKLLIERARLLSKAVNKMVVFENLISQRKDSYFNLVYCGDAKTDGERQVDLVVKLLGKNLSMKVHPFTSKEDLNTRQQILEQFGHGELQGLIAIRCLDEGVDVPATQTAYILASSTNPREFIQRRGRILRKHPKKKYASIYDFIVSPRDLDSLNSLEPELFNLERSIVRRELMRVSEFAKLAENGPQANSVLQPLKAAYNLLDM